MSPWDHTINKKDVTRVSQLRLNDSRNLDDGGRRRWKDVRTMTKGCKGEGEGEEEEKEKSGSGR